MDEDPSPISVFEMATDLVLFKLWYQRAIIEDRLRELARKRQIDIGYFPDDKGQGLYGITLGQSIRMRKDIYPSTMLAVLAHEIAHASKNRKEVLPSGIRFAQAWSNMMEITTPEDVDAVICNKPFNPDTVDQKEEDRADMVAYRLLKILVKDSDKHVKETPRN